MTYKLFYKVTGFFIFAGLLFFPPFQVYSGGSTEINTIEDLYEVKDDLSESYILMNDLDFCDPGDYDNPDVFPGISDFCKTEGATDGWEPIGDNLNEFTGSFDGQGHTISSLFINRPNMTNVGLFGKVGVSGEETGAEVENVGLENVEVIGNERVGGLVGHNFGTISNSYSTGEVTGGGAHVGGLIGRNRDPGTASNSYSTASVSGSTCVGGFAGSLVEWGAAISNSYATGPVSGDDRVGGFVGSAYKGPIFNSYSTGSVSGNDSRVGGFVGNVNWTPISNSFAMGDVTRTAGGSGHFGGFVGYGADGGKIEYSYSIGSIFYDNASDPTDKGFTGRKGSVTFTDNFFDSDTSNQDTDALGTAEPKTTDEMQGITTFSAWDIADVTFGDTNDANVWNIDDGNTYPFLSWQEGHVRDWHDLHAIRNNLDESYFLVSNLDQDASGYDDLASDTANTGAGWEPIGTDADRFTGTFDGDGHTISELFIDRSGTDYVGLFGYVDSGSEVKNVGLKNVDVTGQSRTGGLVGQNNGTVSNSYSTGSVTSDAYYSHAGGLVGQNNGTVSKSYSTGETSGRINVGGLVGRNNGTVSSSYSTGEVSGEQQVGGLVGLNDDKIENSYSTSEVSGNINLSYSVGGLVGRSWGTISNSYSAGEVSGHIYVGGLVGEHDAKSARIENSYSTGEVNGLINAGGLVGRNRSNSTVSNSYATGNVTRISGTDTMFGGFVGQIKDGTIEYSYSTGSVFYDNDDDPDDKGFVGGGGVTAAYTGNFFDSDASNQSTDALGTADPKTTAEMKNIATFNNADWDIEPTLEADPTGGYPFLSWQLGNSPTWYIYGETVMPTVTTQVVTEVGTEQSVLNMSYDFKDYGSGELQFKYRAAGGTWTYTDWSADSDSGTFSETVTGLSPDTEYELVARLKYNSSEIEGDVLTFSTLEEKPPEPSSRPPSGTAQSQVQNLIAMGNREAAIEIMKQLPHLFEKELLLVELETLTERVNKIKELLETFKKKKRLVPYPYYFTRDLTFGSIGEDVKALQKLLNSKGFILASEGPGSPGNETDFFGRLTRDKVIKFQEHYKNEILAPINLQKGTGYVGFYTRTKINSLINL